MESSETVPVAGIPSKLDRRLRLGPFPTGRDALKFLGYACVGSLFLTTSEPALAVPILAGGFLLSVWRPGGDALDERLLVRVRYRLRRSTGVEPMTRRVPRRTSVGSVSRSHSGEGFAIWRCGGVPLAYLPPTELERRFELYRELLQSVRGRLHLLSTGSALHGESLQPRGSPFGSPSENLARAGYAELVGLLARRRGVRRVLLGLSMASSGASGHADLEAAAATLEEKLGGLGVRAERLSGRSLEVALGRVEGSSSDGGP